MAALDDPPPHAPIAPIVAERGRSLREFAFLLVVTALAAALRLYHLERWSLSPVEADTWRLVTMPLEGRTGYYGDPASRSPLTILVLRWLLDSGWLPFHGEGWLRLPFAFVGVLTVPLLALVGRLWTDRRTAMVAALLLAVHPWHVGISQTAATPVVVGCVGLGVAALLLRLVDQDRSGAWRWLGGIALAGLAGITGPGGWLVAISLAVGWTMSATARFRPLQRWLGAGLLVVAATALSLWRHEPSAAAPGPWAWLGGLGLAAVLAAGVGAFVWAALPGALDRRALRFVAAGVLVPLAVTLGRWLVGADAAQGAMALLLPPLLLLAARGTLGAVAATREALGDRNWVMRSIDWSALVAVVALLLVDSFLFVTVFDGGRVPWRLATDRMFDQLARNARLTVWSGEGETPMVYYLRPNHWRDAPRDAHPGAQVRSVAESDPLAVLATAAAEPEGEAHMLVLRTDEVARWCADEATRDRLRDDFACLGLVPSPLDGGGAALQLFRPRGLR